MVVTRSKRRLYGTRLTNSITEYNNGQNRLNNERIDLENLIHGHGRYYHDKKMRDWCNKMKTEIIQSNVPGSKLSQLETICNKYINAPNKKYNELEKRWDRWPVIDRELSRLASGVTRRRSRGPSRKKSRHHKSKRRRRNNRGRTRRRSRRS